MRFATLVLFATSPLLALAIPTVDGQTSDDVTDLAVADTPATLYVVIVSVYNSYTDLSSQRCSYIWSLRPVRLQVARSVWWSDHLPLQLCLRDFA
jgi:hypothetical protein